MRSKHVLATLIGVVVTAGLLATATPVRAATTLCVVVGGTGPPGCYGTIQDAVDDAIGGDTIKVGKGTYFENVVIPAGKDGLIITGKKAIVDPDAPPLVDEAFDVSSNNVIFSKLIIRHGESDGIFVNAVASGIQILGMTFLGQDSDCVDSDGPGLVVDGSKFVGCGSDAVEASLDDHIITGNTMSKCSTNCINLGSGTDSNDVLVEDNSIFQAGTGIIISGTGADVLDNEITNVSSEGISVDANGGSGANITGNSILNTSSNGIDAEDVSDALVEDNELENTGRGIDADGDDMQILGNSITNARGNGIDHEGDRPLVQDNEVEIADGTGINVGGPSVAPQVLDNQVTTTDRGFFVDCDPCVDGVVLGLVQGNSTVDAYTGDGFRIDSISSALLVLENEATNPQDNGFEITGGQVDAYDNVVENAGEDAGDDGFKIDGSSHDLQRNEVTGSADDGFDICGTNHTLVENVSEENIEDGFDIHGEGCGATTGADLDANEATDNLAVGFEVSTGATATLLNSNEASDNQRGDFCDDGTGTTNTPTNEFEVTIPDCVVD